MRFLLIALSAVLTGLCFTFHQVGFLSILTVIPLLYAVLKEAEKDKKPFRFYGYGYMWGAIFYACVFYWFAYQYPLEYLGFTTGEAIAYVALSWFGSGLLLSVVLALWIFFTGLFVRTRLCKKRQWLFIPFTSCLYVIIEYLFTLGPLATPWARLAVTQQSNISGIQTSSVFGSYFISFIIISVNAALAYGLYELTKNKNKKTALICLISAASLFFGNMGAGGILYAVDKTKTAAVDTYITAAAYQSNNVSGRTKTGSVVEVMDAFLADAEEEINRSGADLIVMPEGCFSIDIKKYPSLEEKLLDFCKTHSVVIIFGCYEYADDGFYNVTYCASHDGTLSGPYRKQHPVPFGEFTPVRDILLKIMPFLEDVTDIGDELSAGTESVVFDSNIGKIGSFICFDSAFEQIGYEQTAKGAVLLTESTNDSWWMDSAQLYEHNGHAVLRAVESRKFIVRSATAGYSTVISAEGEILSGVTPLTKGFAVFTVTPRSDISFYHKTPYLFPAVCLSVIICGFIWAVIYKKHYVSKNIDGKPLQN